jgi:uncharacterized delta-60 repeat protein
MPHLPCDLEQLEQRLLLSAVSFAPEVPYPTGSYSCGAVNGDFNDDGMPDLAVVNGDSATLSVLLNDGDGTFAPTTDYATGSVYTGSDGVGPFGVAAGDLDGDGDLDLVTANGPANSVSVFLNDGNGTFAGHVDSPTGGGAYDVIVRDFNADGIQDLAVTDVNASVKVLLGNGNGTFALPVSYAAGLGWRLASGDFNGDGYADLVVADCGYFAPDQPPPGSTVSVLLNNGDGTFAAKTEYTTGSGPLGVTVGDFSGDGIPDLAVANRGGNSVSIFLGTGTGTFSARTDYAAGTGPYDLTSGDFNNDGKRDLAVANMYSDNISVLLGNGDGTFGAKTDFASGGHPASITAGDFNNDGKLDLASGNGMDDSVNVFLNRSPASPGWVSDAPVQTARDQFAAAVVDGKIYIFGGNAYPGGYNLKSLEIFDPSTNTWTYGADNEDNGGQGVEEVTGAAVNGKFYVFGAWGGIGPGGFYGNFNFSEMYDPATDQWTALAPKPTPVSSAPSVVYNGEIYVFGGEFSWEDSEGEYHQTRYDVVEAYNPATDAWRTVTQMPHLLQSPAVAVVEGKAYVIGGYDFSLETTVTSVEAFDFHTGQWITSGLAPMPTARMTSYDAATPVVDGKIYVVGGAVATGTPDSLDFRAWPLDRVDIYDPAANTWTKGPSLPAPRGGNGAVVAVGDTIYVISGGDPDHSSDDDPNYASPAVWSWEVPANPPPILVGRHVFYNNSALDGNDPGANPDDDNAIDAGKQALLPGGTATSANFTNYSRGINGIMVDIQGLASGCTPTANDFIFMITSGGTGSSWELAPSPESISVRPGAGAGGSSRVTIIWPDNAIQGQWLQVIVLSNGGGSLGLAEDDVFCFGNVPGDADGNGAVDASDYMSLKRQFGRSASSGGVTADFDRSGQVDYADLLAVTGNFGQSLCMDVSFAEIVTVDLPADYDTGISDEDNLTNNPTPIIAVTVNYPDIQWVGIYLDDQWVGDAYPSEGQWLYGFEYGQLAEGPNSITARALDSLGQSVTSPALVIALDTIDPGADVSTNADPTFGVDGQVATPLGVTGIEGGVVLAQPDGKAIVSLRRNTGYGGYGAIVRYNADGTLDTAFGSGGQIVPPIYAYSGVLSAALQADGKILVAGCKCGTGYDFALVRYNADGSLDTSFGVGGIAQTDIGGWGSYYDYATAVAVQADGKIVVAGMTGTYWPTPSWTSVLVRYNADGSLDTSFGAGGKVLDSLGPTEGVSLAFDAAGRVLTFGQAYIAGTWQTSNVLVRYSAGGAPDPSFGVGGRVTALPGMTSAAGRNLVIQKIDGQDEKILVAGSGYSYDNYRYVYAVARYSSAGVLDAAFGSGGTAITPAGDYRGANWLALQSDEMILVSGKYYGADMGFAVVRFSPNGSLDTGFGSGGVKKLPAPGPGWSPASWSSLALQADGHMFITGSYGGGEGCEFLLTRLDSVGNVDSGYGQNGQAPEPLPEIGSSWINASVMQPDGKIVTAGLAFNGSNWDIAICRYNTDGSLDSSFGSGGTIVTRLPDFYGTAAGLTIQPGDNKIVVALDDGYSLALARYNADGTLDSSFGSGGIVRFTDGVRRGFNSVCLQPDDGKIVASGWKAVGSDYRTLLCRFNPDGSLDTTFGVNGEVVVPTIYWYSYDYPSLILLPGGEMLVRGYDLAGDRLPQDCILLRYLPDGSLDASFADNGKLTLSPGPDREWQGPAMFAVDGDGRILIAGGTMDRPDSGSRYEVIVSRYLPDGSIDAGFGEGGTASIWLVYGDSVSFLSVLSDGRILAAGYYGNLYAFSSDGQPDGRVGVGGICQPNAPGGSGWSTGFVQPDGKVVLAGQRWSANRYDSSLLRLEPPASSYEWASIELQASSDTGARDRVTFDNTPTFDVRGGGPYWRIYRDGQLVSDPFCTGPAWTSEPLPDGYYTFQIAMVDAAGNEFFSDDQMVTVGAVPPDLQASSDSGVNDHDDVTSDNTPTFTLYGRTANLHVYCDGELVGAVPTIVGEWTSPPLSDGGHYFNVVEVDDEGNEIVCSQELYVTISTQKPSAPSAPDLVESSDTGISNTDNLTADTAPVFYVSSTDSFVRVYRDGTLVSDPFKAGYEWRSAELADGTYYFQVSSVDAAGNESDLSEPLSVTIETVPPPPPPPPDLLAEYDSGVSHTDNITNDLYPVFAIPGGAAGFRVYRDGELVSTPDSWETGDTWWSQWLDDGTYAFQVSLADAAGNESPKSEPLYVTIDTQAPEVTVDFLITEFQRPPLSGTVSEPVTTVIVTVYGASYIGEYDGDGTWSLAAGLLLVPPGTHDVAVEVSDLAGNVGYDNTSNELFISSNFFDDPNLEAAVCDRLGVSPESFTPELLASISYLDAHGRGITNLDGMQFCTGLANLYLYDNQIADLAPLGGLVDLTWLMIWDNQITDIGPLAGLVNLGGLYIAGNSIQDIEPLRLLTEMRSLGIDWNDISDISALSELTNLAYLWLSGNPISDLSPLAGMENLRELHLRESPGLDLSTLPALPSLITLDLADSGISDLSPLAKLTALEDLNLSRNDLSDVSGLSGMVSLRRLDLGRNQIVDLWPLAGLTNLEYLDLDHNSVSSLDALWGLTALHELYAWNNDITSLVPLLANTGLGGGDVVGIGGNPLSANALAVQIPALQSRGVRVDLESDPRLDVDYVYIDRAFINYAGQPIGSPVYGLSPWLFEVEVEGFGLHGVSITTPSDQVIVMQENEDHEWAYQQDFSSRDAMLAVFPSGVYVLSFNNGQDGVAVLFNTPEPTGIPDITFPSAGATDVPWDHPTFTWTSCAGFGQQLWFGVMPGEGPDDEVYEGDGTIDVTSWTLPGALEPGHEYVFAVEVDNVQTLPEQLTALGDRFEYECDFDYINHVVFTTAGTSAPLPAVPPADSPATDTGDDALKAAMSALLAEVSIRAGHPATATYDAPKAPAASKSHVATLLAPLRNVFGREQAKPELADVLGLAQPPWPVRWAATRRLEEPLEIGPDLDVLPSRRGSLPGLDEPDGQIIWLSGV